jgi:hypothetical protein
MSILTLQRRLVEVGRIRMGEKRRAQSGKEYPAKLETWRLTSPDRQRLDAAAEVYGGTVGPWEAQHELVTQTSVLDIALIPGQALVQHMEQWGQKKPRGPVVCLRRCDGERELLTDQPCVCQREAGDDGQLACKPTTHLLVMLRNVPGIGAWRLATHGYYSAVELAGTAGLLEQLTARGQLVPARLRLDQRSVVREDGTKHFVVPVIDIDVALDQVLAPLGMAAVAAQPIEGMPATRAIEAPRAPFTPVPVDDLPEAPLVGNVRDQVRAVDAPPAQSRRANAAVPIPATGLRPRAVVSGGSESAPAAGETAPAPSATAAVAAPSEPSQAAPIADTADVTDDPDEIVDEQRAHWVARWCAEAGIVDGKRAAFLWAFSDGRYDSSKQVRVADLAKLRATLVNVNNGRLVLDTDGDTPVLRAPDEVVEQVTPGQPVPASVYWKSRLADVRGVGPVKLLKAAASIAARMQLPVPVSTSFDDMPDNDQFKVELNAWLVDQANDGAA